MLPAERPLGTDSQLLFELDGAELHFTGRAGGLPALRARPAGEGRGARLEVISAGGSLTVRRAAGEDPVPLRLDVTLGPGRTVRVAGRDLLVRVEDDLPPDAGRSVFDLVLERSTAEVSGARVPRAEAADSSLRLTAAGGPLDLTLTGGSAEVRDHGGSVRLAATGADVVVAGQEGELKFRVQGGRLDVLGGAGSCTGNVRDADLLVDGRNGPVEVGAEDAGLTGRGAGIEDGRWTIDGRNLEVLLQEIRGSVALELEGGHAGGSDLRADLRAKVAGAGARFELLEVAGSVELEVREGAEAWLTGISGELRADLSDARLDASGVGGLTLDGARATATVRGVERLDRLVLADSELELDLREVRGDPALELLGASRGRVRLPPPCVVQVAGSEAPHDLAIEVTGCELRFPGQRPPARQDRQKYGVPPTRLTVTMGRDTVLDVEGGS